MQPRFSYFAAVGSLALFAAVVAGDRLLSSLPNRYPSPPAVARLHLEPVDIDAAEVAPLAVVGAWRMQSPEPRFGGVSALASDGEELVALTDRGVVLRFPKRPAPNMAVLAADLPGGPGDPRFKRNRDSEALLRDPAGRGWWVSFENQDELWLYDRKFERALGRVGIPNSQLEENAGIEALASSGGEMVAFPEPGGLALAWNGARWSRIPLDGNRPLSDAVEIEPGRLLLVERQISASGFKNALALAESDGSGFRTVWRRRLPVAWRDNLEAIAVEPAGGGYRLWLMSDDNYHPRLRTLLIVIDVPAAALPKRP